MISCFKVDDYAGIFFNVKTNNESRSTLLQLFIYIKHDAMKRWLCSALALL